MLIEWGLLKACNRPDLRYNSIDILIYKFRLAAHTLLHLWYGCVVLACHIAESVQE